MATPLEIEILMYYATRGDDFPRLDAPAVQSAVAAFLRAGLLAPADECDFHDRRYMPTEGTRAYVDALTAVPLPERRWVLPGARPPRLPEWGDDPEPTCEAVRSEPTVTEALWPLHVAETQRQAAQDAVKRAMEAIRSAPGGLQGVDAGGYGPSGRLSPAPDAAGREPLTPGWLPSRKHSIDPAICLHGAFTRHGPAEICDGCGLSRMRIERAESERQERERAAAATAPAVNEAFEPDGSVAAAVEGVPVAFIRDLAEHCRRAEIDPAGLRVAGDFDTACTLLDPLGLSTLSLSVSARVPAGDAADHLIDLRDKRAKLKQAAACDKLG